MRRMRAQADLEGKSLYAVRSRVSLGPDLFLIGLRQTYRNSPGTLAMFAAIHRASSLVSSLAADLRPGSS